ncbi:MAG: hypothetical protein EAY72_05770 [Bacteroidetes bacterium]|nr:MAG: hypothetical protein EAY72_05770 [Bacteroidota bacterium]
MAMQSCIKTNEPCESLEGKWTLLETFDGYVNGGNFRWNQVASWYSTTLQINADSTFVETTTSAGQAPTICNGTIRLQDSTLTMFTNCNTSPLPYKISSRQCSEIILDRRVIEGVIRYKYVR